MLGFRLPENYKVLIFSKSARCCFSMCWSITGIVGCMWMMWQDGDSYSIGFRHSPTLPYIPALDLAGFVFV